MAVRGPLRRRSTWIVILTVVAAVSGMVSLAALPGPRSRVVAVTGPVTSPAPEQPTSSPMPTVPPTPTAERPNLVFVLADDLDVSLLRFMPETRRMQRAGASFRHYTVANSLCCPSRASILTGRYPHSTKVFTNSAPDGGYARFRKRGLEQQTYAVALQRAGYRTGFMGKYLNGYGPRGREGGPYNHVPPGWDSWAVARDGYREFDYSLNVDGRVVRYGKRSKDYLTDVLARRGERFVRRAATDRRPFALEIATFAPHMPYVPAPRDQHRYRRLKAPRGASFNERDIGDKPAWLRKQPKLSRSAKDTIDRIYRKRAQSVRSIDALLARLRIALRETGQLDNTYVVFSSDNGLHLGQHRLPAGKQTAFTSDVVVPLVVTGPGVQHRRVAALAQNVDLAPTFTELGGTRLPGADGRSLLPLLRGTTPADWRRYALVEHHGPDTDPSDPDYQPPSAGNPPSYAGVLTERSTYVVYGDGEREFYDNRKDPKQLENRADSLTRRQRRAADAHLRRLVACRGTAECQLSAPRSSQGGGG